MFLVFVYLVVLTKKVLMSEKKKKRKDKEKEKPCILLANGVVNVFVY